MFEHPYAVGAVALIVLIAVAIWQKQLWRYWTAFWNWAGEQVPDISRQNLVAIISVLGSVVAVIATYFWLRNPEDARAEPTSQFVIAIAWLIVAVLQLLIPSDPEWEIFHAKRAKHDQDILQRVLYRIREERLDFDQIVSNRRRYNSAPHKKAVEVDSFNMLLPEIQALSSIPKFRRRANIIAKEIERNQALDKKEVEQLIVLLNQIEPQIQHEIEKLGRIHRGLA